MEHGPESSNELILNVVASRQFSYHVKMAAVFAVAGETDESASEAVLAWTILATCWTGADAAASATAAELIGQDQAGMSDLHRDAAHVRAHALALELEAHFTSVGLHDDAALYASVVQRLAATMHTLANSS